MKKYNVTVDQILQAQGDTKVVLASEASHLGTKRLFIDLAGCYYVIENLNQERYVGRDVEQAVLVYNKIDF